MLVDIDKVKAVDRIRKDFGNIAELAEDIKANGLINPPVVIPESDGTFTLLAGERRLKAMQMLGYKQIEIRTWRNISNPERLEIEISENEQRKDFTTLERYEMFKRRYEYLLDSRESGKLKQEAARDAKISPNTVSKVETILDNQGFLTEEEFQSWASGNTPTAEAYRKVQNALEKEKSAREIAEGDTRKLQQRLTDTENKLAAAENKPPKVVRVEVEPADYTEAKRKLSSVSHTLSVVESDKRRLLKELEETEKKLRTLEEQANAAEEGTVKRLNDDTLFFCAKVDNFLVGVGGYAYLADRMSEISKENKKMYMSAIRAVTAWGQNIIDVIGE